LKWFKLLFVAAAILSVAWVGFEANAAISVADVAPQHSNPGAG